MQPYRILPKGTAAELTVLNLATVSNEVEFDQEFQTFKISPVDVTGLTAGTISLRASGKVIYLTTGTQVQMTYSVDFVWTVHLDTPVNRLSLLLGAATSADVVFQITGYVTTPM